MSEISLKLQPIYDTLSKLIFTLRHYEEKYPNISQQELRVVQDQLRLIDQKYSEARIVVRGEIPSGQAAVSELLDEAHERVRKLVTCSHCEMLVINSTEFR
jgi:tRNA(Arg) A34 adenosine deaminase TadA